MLTSVRSIRRPIEEETLQLPDLQFVNHCFRKYGLNRGIYNTIDEWLYRNGTREVIRRRQTILDFLSSLQQSEPGRSTFLKFGKGGLTKRLQEFVLERQGGRTTSK
ncbi:hypothetical protein LJK88_27420 [Paenibacillus sp. P26]|nr:hypothetical protein LJK88_27420 [Paenibacillus sp. P26]